MKLSAQRQQLLEQFVGKMPPRLWCPPLTHYRDDGSMDLERMEAHWRWLAPNTRSFLVPGSTGDGWEMNEAEIDALLDAAVALAPKVDARILIGALKPTTAEAVQTIQRQLARLKQRRPQADTLEVLRQFHVCGFAVCPPSGAALSQTDIRTALDSVLALEVPVALYQLPQVTQNEMAPETVAALAEKFPNLLFFKDTSGGDRVPNALHDTCDVYFVRGAEGDYADWLREAGGPYGGLLLGSANVYAPQYREMIALVEAGQLEEARALARRLTQAVVTVTDLVANLPYGNPFSNQSKAVDHFMAYGPEALSMPPPRLHSGATFSPDILKTVRGVLQEMKFLPDKGYWR